ncbi:hypothetical protein [Paeniglutamicibacter psychrophenolicus]|uniref:hypothetical protein n=1 Tax=Paeniglutamicibacter psychrophenolicus TaxID=257454 RepID=UPI002785DC17|nr:hypothetical protein [Paeniglutamicibacter psychrophenolicus]MDQ0094408.1 hypothetical protein [Paeniglutamicibacter psychrophenolicus]
MTTNDPNPWAALSRALFTGAPLEAEPAATPPAEPTDPPAPAAQIDPFRQWEADTAQQQAKATVVERIAAAHNVPAAALVGNTPEELTQHAQALSAWMGDIGAPVIDGQGTTPPPAAGMPRDLRAMLNLMSAPHLRS